MENQSSGENTGSAKSKVKSKIDNSKSPEVAKENNKPMGGKLDISKIRSFVERNVLDNDRLQQKAEARKSDSHNSRLETDKSETKINNNESVDNLKHHKDGNKTDNYHHFETENGAVKRKKKKKRKSERPDCLSSTKALTNVDSNKSEQFDSKSANSNSKPNASNRFSCVDGPRIPKR